MTEAVIFDMDGVLVDSEPFHIEIEKRQFRLNGLNISEEEHHRYMGVASDVMWREISANHRLAVPVETLIGQNKQESIRFFSEVSQIPLMPGLLPLLEELWQRKFPMAVASSSIPEIIDIVLNRTGIRKYFSVVVSSTEAGKSKPEPDVFLLAAQKMGVKPGHCLVVEDSFNGITAAHAAGMRCVAFCGPGANPENQRMADDSISDFLQLEPLLMKTSAHGKTK